MYSHAPDGKSARSFQRGTALLLVAALVGVYLGGSTVAQIDPFYRSGAIRSGGSSYTVDGWRGANATAPPSKDLDIDYPYSSNPAPYEVARYVAPAVGESIAYVGGAVRDFVAESPPASDTSAQADYRCVDCGDAMEEEPTDSASPAACRDEDRACFRDAPAPDDEAPVHGDSGHESP